MLASADDHHRLASQRVDAAADIVVRHLAGRSRLERLYQDGAAKIRLPRVSDGPLEAVLINTAGGLTGGDRLSWSAEAREGASLSLTTQACEKLYRAEAGRAEVSVRLRAAAGAGVAWLPQETIVYDGAAMSRRIDVELAAGSRLLLVEATVFGRRAMGERVRRATVRDRWNVRRAGALLHAEAFAIGPAVEDTLSRRAVANGATALATVLLIAEDAERNLPAVRDVIGPAGGASVWATGAPGIREAAAGKLLARLAAEDFYALRQRLAPLIRLLNGEAGLPRIWSL